MEIKRVKWDESMEYIRHDEPVVLLDCPLNVPNQNRWDFDHLATVIDPSFKCDVYCSRNKRFTYWDESKNKNGYNFQPPTTKITMTFPEFLEYHKTQHSNPDCTETRYVQAGVVQEMGPVMLKEYTRFSLDAARKFQDMGQWDGFSTNLLLCGAAGFITPVHYDEQQNIFAQLSGTKRVRLFPPEAFARLYPYPLGHPSDRQSQVRLPTVCGSTILDEESQRSQFPAFDNGDPAIAERYVDLQPGECLYIPQYWWHQMEGLTDNVSLSWWYKHQKRDRKTTSEAAHKDDLSVFEKDTVNIIAVRRNVERLLGDMVGGGQSAHNFFLAMASGLLAIPPVEDRANAPTVGVTFLPRYYGYTDLPPGSDDSAIDTLPFPTLPRDVSAAAGLPTPLPAQWPSVAQQVVKFVSMVLEPAKARNFLFELSTGRFSTIQQGGNAVHEGGSVVQEGGTTVKEG